jgi:hypothetical protein
MRRAGSVRSLRHSITAITATITRDWCSRYSRVSLSSGQLDIGDFKRRRLALW